MNNTEYRLAGWLSLISAVIFPLTFIVGIVQGIIGAAAFGYHGPTMGPSDLLSLIFAAIHVYVLWKLRSLLQEHYDFHGLDTLIPIAIAWNVLFQISGILLKVLAVAFWPSSELALTLVFMVFFVVAMITAGMINIFIAVRLLKIEERLSDLLRVYAFLVLVAGILQVTVILSPFSLLLVPVFSVLLGVIFLKERHQPEFV